MKNPLPVLRHLIVLLLLSTSLQSFAQGGCLEFNLRVFAIELVYEDGQQPHNPPRLYLVNERMEHYWYEPASVSEDPGVRKTRVELKQNNPKNAKPGKNPYARHHHWPALAENLYTCTIPVQKNEDKTKPLYQVLVVWNHTGEPDSLLVHLPYSKALDPCQNELKKKGTELIVYPDGSPFMPLQIQPLLRLPEKNVIYPINEISLVPSYHVIRDASGRDSQIALTGLDILQTQTLASIQRLEFAPTKHVPINLRNDLFETGDFMSDNPAGIADFRIARKDESDPTNQISRKYFDHYLWHPESNRYILKPELSQKPNVNWQRVPGELHAYAINLSDTEKTVIDYLFTSSGWKLVNSTSYPTPQQQKKEVEMAAPAAVDCVSWKSEPMRMQAVFEAPGNEINFFYEDSLLFDYACNARDAFEISPSQIKNLFSIRTSVREKNGAFYLREYCNVSPGSIQLVERNTYIKHTNGKQEMIGFFRFIVAPDTRLTDAKGKLLGYLSKSYDNGITAWMIELGASGKPVGYGQMELKGRQKTGTWQRWSETGERLNPEYHRQKITLTIENPNRIASSLTVSAKESGVWKTIPHTALNDQYQTGKGRVLFFMKYDCDSVRVKSGAFTAEYRFVKQQFQPEAHLSLYLIGKNEDFIDMGTRIPIDWDESAYAMLWDNEWLSSTYNRSEINTAKEQIAATIRAKFPEISLYPYSEQCQCMEITFTRGTSQRKMQIIDALLKEPSVKALSQMLQTPGGHRTYLSDYVYVQTDVNLRNEQVMEIGKKYGLRLSNVYGSGNGWSAYTGDRLIDRNWLIDKQRILQEPGVLSSSYSWFMEITVD